MAESFGQRTDPLAVLGGILAGYSFSDQIIKEIIQNTEDAKATIQIIFLDRRTHPTVNLYHANLAPTQGPALLFFNDGILENNDWEALQNMYRSSKTQDSNKIGKFGIGFRSVFHITDCPQILSGKGFAISDPYHAFTDSEGMKLTTASVVEEYHDHIQSILPSSLQHLLQDGEFKGTVIRCPLRADLTASSGVHERFSSEIVTPDRVSKIVDNFVAQSLDDIALFLKNLRQITVIDINEAGTFNTLADVTYTRNDPVWTNETSSVRKVITQVSRMQDPSKILTTWTVTDCRFPEDGASRLLSQRVVPNTTVDSTMRKHKLNSCVSLAVREQRPNEIVGTLYTHLPLPIKTSFNVHINAIFALTKDRQHLANAEDKGIAAGTEGDIFRKWNELQFECFIPQAWKDYLQYVVGVTSKAEDIYTAWPASAGTSYWENVPQKLLELVVTNNLMIWPVHSPSEPHQTKLKALNSQDIVVANPSHSTETIAALTALGVDIINLPKNIWSLVQKLSLTGINHLTPTTAHSALLEKPRSFSEVSSNTRLVILQYLVSDNKIQNLVGLPIIPHASLGYVFLQSKHSCPLYTLLDDEGSRLFNDFDTAYNITLSSLPSNVASLLLAQGPRMLNVQTLSNDKVISYLNIFLQQSTTSFSSTGTVKWLLSFWEWLADHKDHSSLLQRIKDMPLIPCLNGVKSYSEPLFSSRSLVGSTVDHLQALSLSFVRKDFHSHKLSSIYNPRDPADIHAIVEALPSSLPTSLQPNTADVILRHISNHATASARKKGFTKSEIQKLRSIPLYPIVSAGGKLGNLTSLPASGNIQFVRTSPAYIPRVPGTIFVKLDDNRSSQLTDALAPATDTITREGLLDLALDHFSEQTKEVCMAVLLEIEGNRSWNTQRIVTKLNNTRFLRVGGSNTKISPAAAVDPSSPLAELFEEGNTRVPLQDGEQRTSIVCLQNIQLMQRALTVEMLEERITYISRQNSRAPKAVEIAKNLLLHLADRQSECAFDLRSVDPELIGHQKLAWLPTNVGLYSPERTWDPSDTSVSRYLYNKVLPRLDFDYATQFVPGLKRFLGWNRPLPTAVIIEQFEKVLSSNPDSYDVYAATMEIISELSQRSPVEQGTLKRITAGRPWVPTSNKVLVQTEDGVFDSPALDSGFYRISVSDACRQFMIDLGCMVSPSTTAIIRKLEGLCQRVPNIKTVRAGVALLHMLPAEISGNERNVILVPDTNMIFRPLTRTKFNDIYFAASTALIDDLGEYFLAHRELSDALAYRLGMDRLGISLGANLLPDLTMGAKPIEQVRNVLKGYDPKQFLIEFVANAVDANAKTFSVMLNEHIGEISSPGRVLSPSTMGDLIKSPSLVIHNDAQFTDRDFVGICETSVGGKRDMANTIGRFGLGSATMFYFCELAMIISRDCVLFLNPSGKLLPNKKTALMLTLNNIRECYPDHLASLGGVFGLDTSPTATEDYEGTLFVLPLRCRASRSSTHDKTWDPVEIQRDVLEPFFDKMASNCLLFTNLDTIEAQGRRRPGTDSLGWKCSAERKSPASAATAPYSYCDVTITSRRYLQSEVTQWRVAQHRDLAVPEELLVPGFRFQNPGVAGIALPRGKSRRSSMDSSSKEFYYFSVLPLPIPTSLGAHIMASFYLSPDRRSIRLDKSSSGDTNHNRWLLRDIIPPLYIFLLETFATCNIGNKTWWPSPHGDSGDYMCGEIIESFYSSHLPTSLCQVFNSISSSSIVLSPSKAVILQNTLPAAVIALLNHLKPERLVKLGHEVTTLIQKHSASALTYVTPEFLREEILNQEVFVRNFFPLSDNSSNTPTVSSRITSFSEPSQLKSNVHKLQDIYKYLTASNLIGLSILALDDATFASFQPKSSSPTYFARPSANLSFFRHGFKRRNFIHRELDQAAVAELDLNVKTFGASEIVQLIGETVSKQDHFRNVPSATAKWVSEFWKFWGNYKAIGLNTQHIREFPLVPTISPDRYVSLEACEESDSVILIVESPPNARLLGEALTKLDLFTVFVSESVTPVQQILNSFNQSQVAMLGKHVGNLHSIIQRLGDGTEHHLEFASFARRLVSASNKLDRYKESLSRSLPIWPTYINSQEYLRSANDTNMLPVAIDASLATKFTSRPLSRYDACLGWLNGPRLQYDDIPTILDVTARVSKDPSELQDYKSFLESWIGNITYPLQVSTYIPNPSGQFVPVTTLYARDQLFLDSFGNDSEHFTSAIFEPLRDKLERHGLKRQSKLDFSMFVECANAMDKAVLDLNPDHSTSVSELVRRAAAVFKVYTTDVAIITLKHETQNSLLPQLDGLAFIPRRMTSRRFLPSTTGSDGIEIPSSITELSRIVKPSILVREEYEAVAWTQRACFDVQPDKCILSTYDKLGRPSVFEVVLHLESLCEISKASTLTTSQKEIIVEDVKSSYVFLMKILPSEGSEQPSDEDISILPSDIGTREIFLNISDPADVTEEWTWRTAHQLIYTDKEDYEHVFGVKKFLSGYRSLLSSAGVVTEFQPSISTAEPASDNVLREKFNDLRKSWPQFNDIVIEATNEAGESVLLPAHRVYLAASSGKPDSFDAQHLRQSEQGPPILSPRYQAAGEEKLFSEQAVNHLLNYVYSVEFRTAPDADRHFALNDALQTLRLAYQWRTDDVFDFMERYVTTMINPRTLKQIRETAVHCHASKLIPACEEYGSKNRVYLERVLGGD